MLLKYVRHSRSNTVIVSVGIRWRRCQPDHDESKEQEHNVSSHFLQESKPLSLIHDKYSGYFETVNKSSGHSPLGLHSAEVACKQQWGYVVSVVTMTYIHPEAGCVYVSENIEDTFKLWTKDQSFPFWLKSAEVACKQQWSYVVSFVTLRPGVSTSLKIFRILWSSKVQENFLYD